MVNWIIKNFQQIFNHGLIRKSLKGSVTIVALEEIIATTKIAVNPSQSIPNRILSDT